MLCKQRTRTARSPWSWADPRLALGALAAVVLCAVPASTARAESPYLVPDQSWISLTGTVADTDVDEFTLDYGEGLITVEMDEWAWYAGDTPVTIGDRVTVYGRIDDDLFEGREVVADSIFVSDRATYYYAADVDPLAVYSFPVVIQPDGSWLTVSGEVKKVKGREFVIDTGHGELQIDTVGLGYNPLDDVGLQKIEPGDRVSVSGHLDLDFFERKEIMADSIVTLSRDEQKAAEKTEKGGSSDQAGETSQKQEPQMQKSKSESEDAARSQTQREAKQVSQADREDGQGS